MTFNVAADAYGKFMGQYSEPLAVPFAEAAGVRAVSYTHLTLPTIYSV